MTNEMKVLIAIAAVTLVVLGGGVWLFSMGQAKSDLISATKVDNAQLIKADSIRKGDPNAKATLVEFGDLQCPACKQAAPGVEYLMQNYGDKIQVVFRHFPLPQHPNAVKAAQAAESAHEQGKFWEMYKKLYDVQDEWANLPKPAAEEKFRSYAQGMGLDMNRFNTSFNENKHKDKIQSDYSDGSSLGVSSTPTFYLNGQKIEGFNLQQVKAQIDQILGTTQPATGAAQPATASAQ